jgi:hypothetical protein
MATTTNYGWTTPDDTDLVKDGAAAIRTLGSSIDTTTKNLNPETTTGDIAYRSATANTNTRLAIGTTGQILTVAGGVPSWASPAGGGGKVLQVVSSVITTGVTIGSTTLTDSGITATITPTLATSKVLVIINANSKQNLQSASEEDGIGGKVLRGATTVLDFGSEGLSIRGHTNSAAFFELRIIPIMYLDSPATTSATTYKLQVKNASTASSQQIFMQPSSNPSVITLLEIGA